MTDILELHNTLHELIDNIDEQLDSQGDQSSATRRKLMNEFIETEKPTWHKVVEQLKGKFDELSTEQQIGLYFGLTRELNKTFSEPLGKSLDALVESAPKPEVVKLSTEEVEKLSTARSDLYKKIKQLVDTAVQFGMDKDEDGNVLMKYATKRTGGRGPRGPRAISFVTWTIDGEPVEDNHLKSVVDQYDQYDKVKDLTAAMREAKINLTTPEAEFSFNLPDGKILKGVYNPQSTPVVDDEDDEDEVSDDDDE